MLIVRAAIHANNFIALSILFKSILPSTSSLHSQIFLLICIYRSKEFIIPFVLLSIISFRIRCSRLKSENIHLSYEFSSCGIFNFLRYCGIHATILLHLLEVSAKSICSLQISLVTSPDSYYMRILMI